MSRKTHMTENATYVEKALKEVRIAGMGSLNGKYNAKNDGFSIRATIDSVAFSSKLN